jgi:hypothetical protein
MPGSDSLLITFPQDWLYTHTHSKTGQEHLWALSIMCSSSCMTTNTTYMYCNSRSNEATKQESEWALHESIYRISVWSGKLDIHTVAWCSGLTYWALTSWSSLMLWSCYWSLGGDSAAMNPPSMPVLVTLSQIEQHTKNQGCWDPQRSCCDGSIEHEQCASLSLLRWHLWLLKGEIVYSSL